MDHLTKEEVINKGFEFAGEVNGHEVYCKRASDEGEFLCHIIGSEGKSIHKYPQSSSIEMVSVLAACANKLFG